MGRREYLLPPTKALPPPASYHPQQTLRALRRRPPRKHIVMPSGAPTDAEYLVLAANSILTQARIFSVSGLLVATDSGHTGGYNIDLDEADLILANLPTLAGEIAALYIADTLLTTNGDLIYRAAGAPSRLGIGSAGQVLTVSAGLPSWATPSTNASPPPGPPQLVGQYVSGFNLNANVTTVSLTLNQLYMVPFYVPVTTTYDQFALNKTASGSANVHVGIYGPWTGALASLPLILDSGVLAFSGSQILTASISQQLSPGWYMLAALSDTTANFRAHLNTAVPNFLGQTSLSTNGTTMTQNAQAYGNLPSNSPSSPSPVSGTVPIIALRVASIP